jgi:hypothetical protein
MADTVLAHIAGSITQKENLGTEALAFILNRSAAARVALRDQIAAILGDVPVVARVATQLAIGEESRPDLMLHGDDGRTLGYVEAKFWAALTNAQPVEYVRRLAAAGGGVLVLLAPERRLPTLRAEVIERLRPEPAMVGAQSLKLGRVRIGVLSWSRLLGALGAAVADDRASASDVAQLAGLVARFEADGFLPLTRSELDDLEVPRRMLAIGQLVNEIVERGVLEGILSTKGLRGSHAAGHTGRYVAFASAGAWLGLSHWQWAARGRTPMWLRFAPDAWGRAAELRGHLRAWAAADPPQAYLDDEDRSVRLPLLLPVGVEKDVVIATVVQQLREIESVMRAAGMPPLAGAVPPPTEE